MQVPPIQNKIENKSAKKEQNSNSISKQNTEEKKKINNVNSQLKDNKNLFKK